MPKMKKMMILMLLCFGGVLNFVESRGLFGGLCPEPACECGMDFKGRMEVSCTIGRMVSIPTSQMSPSTEIIRIDPPRNQPNILMIGRFFTQFKKLEELHIVGSNIPNIGENSFWGMQSLRVLNLTRNNITSVMEINFKGLVELEILSLSENSIETLISQTFQPMSKLRRLDLSRNRINKLVERLFYNLHLLESLDLSENWLRELKPDVFRDVWKLKELKCRRCGIKGINPLLYKLLPDIRILDLGDNDFKYLNKDEFGLLIHLDELYLDGNQISNVIDETFQKVRLTKLNLGSNEIHTIEIGAFDNASIYSLDISKNQLVSINPNIFSTLRKNLTQLAIGGNVHLKYPSLMLVLAENTQLKWLSLADGLYEDLPLELFEFSAKNLEYLNLSGNRIVDVFPHQVKNMKKLRVLDLSRNMLKGLDSEILFQFDQELISLKELYLNGNPWACDLCNIPDFLRWAQTSPLFEKGCYDPHSKYCLRCSSPPNLKEKSIISLYEDNLEWCDNNAQPASILADDPRLGLFIVCTLVLIILIFATFAILFHSRWHAAHYYTHEGTRPEIGTPPLPPDYDDDYYYSSNTQGSQSGGGQVPQQKKKMIATIEEMTFVEPPMHFRDINDQLVSIRAGQSGGGNGELRESPKIQLLQNCQR